MIPNPATGGVDATPPGLSAARRGHQETIAALVTQIDDLRAENSVLRDENQLLLAKCDVAHAAADTWRARYEGVSR